VEGNAIGLRERVEEWPRAAVRLLETPDGFVHIHLFVTGDAMVERFDREGRLLEGESARWTEGGERTQEEPDLAHVLVAFGVPEAEARAIAAAMRAQAEPLAGTDEPWWKEAGFWLKFVGIFIAGWVVAAALAIWLLVRAVA
jgi:hypothetical protein